MNACNKKRHMLSFLIILIILISIMGIVSADTAAGQGKPKGIDIYIQDVPYSASLAGSVNSSEKGPADFQVIVEDDNPGKGDPDWFTKMGETPTQTPTPTPTPRPIATVEIPVDEGGPGKQLCVTDNTSEIIVEFAFAACGYKNVFYLDQPHKHQLGWTKGDPKTQGDALGTVWNLGTFPTGTELIFADTADMGTSSTKDDQTYYTGPASRNKDNAIHGAVTLFNKTGGTYHKYLVSFEDLLKSSWSGKEPDFDDVEFYVSGSLSTDCSTDDEEEDTGSAAIVPIYTGNICRCPPYTDDKCIAQFTYITKIDRMVIPIKTKKGESPQPWNEFTGSGMVKWDRCQPEIFFVNTSNAPFWTDKFWNNIKWSLGSVHSDMANCTHYKETDMPGDSKFIPNCSSIGAEAFCAGCLS